MKTKTLAQIEQEIEVHRLAIADLRQQGIALLTGEQPADPPAPKVRASTAKKPRTPRSEGLPAKIVAVLARVPLAPYTADEVIGELKAADKEQQVRTTLSRMVKQKKIFSTAKGYYRLTPIDGSAV